MSKSISDRIQAALKGGKSEGVSALIAEVKAAADQSQQASAAARKRALDPLLSAKELSQARQDSEDALFNADRMNQAAVALDAALKDFLAVEDQQRRIRGHASAKRQRDAAVARIKARYATLANDLGMLMNDAVAADAAVVKANQEKPDGAEHLASVDFQLRGFYPGLGNEASIRRLADAVVLPSLDRSTGRIWGNGTPFHPDQDTAPVSPDTDAARTEKPGVPVPSARLSVRPLPTDAGEAA